MVAAILPVSALTQGAFDYAGYTITVTPDDLEHPGQAGTITITNADGSVDLAGTYAMTENRPPTLVIDLAGTVTTAEGVMDVERTFTFEPQTKKMVWRQVVAWIESLIEA
jgi:hypothetical protein